MKRSPAPSPASSSERNRELDSYEALLSQALEPVAPRPDFVATLQERLAGAGEPGGALSYTAFTVGLSVFILGAFAAAVGLVWGARALIVTWQQRLRMQNAN